MSYFECILVIFHITYDVCIEDIFPSLFAYGRQIVPTLVVKILSFLHIISILKNLLRHVLWPKIGCPRECFPLGSLPYSLWSF